LTTTHTANLDEKMLDSANNNQVDDDFVLDGDTSFGQRLRQAREQQNLSIDEAASAMFLDENIIVALETEAFSQLPPPIYVQGYLRNYAKLLKLPMDKVLNSYKQMCGNEKYPELGPEISGQSCFQRQNPKKNQPLLAVFLIIGLVAFITWQLVARVEIQQLKNWFSFGDKTEEFITPSLLNSDGEVITDLLLPLPAPNQSDDIDLGSPIINGTDNSEVNVDVEIPTIDDTVEVTTEIKVEAATADITETLEISNNVADTPDNIKTVENTEETTVKTVAESDKTEAISDTPIEVAKVQTNMPWIVLQFKGESWTTIKDSKGKRLYYGTSKADETATIYEGTPPFRLVLGKPNEVEVEYRGQAVDLSGYKGGVARLKLGEAPE
jgi:cytoskeleton protein RodZ